MGAMLRLLSLAAEVARPETDKIRSAMLGAVAVRADGVIVHARNGSDLLVPPTAHAEYRVLISPTAHAEYRVLRKCGRGADVYVARVRRDGGIALAKPCPSCVVTMRNRGVKNVFWTVNALEWAGMELGR